jgi:hypothetical protein
MLFMVIERFKDEAAVAERFKDSGRLLPDGVVYHASWVEPDGSRCFQLMEAPDRPALDGWVRRWQDICDFEVVSVLPSQEFWARLEGSAGT